MANSVVLQSITRNGLVFGFSKLWVVNGVDP